MRIKTIVIVVVTILLTAVIMQNTGSMWFKILWMNFQVSKLLVMLIVAVLAFLIGYLVGRPKRRINLSGAATGADHHDEKPDKLSEEDRDYIN